MSAVISRLSSNSLATKMHLININIESVHGCKQTPSFEGVPAQVSIRKENRCLSGFLFCVYSQ
jgi:hypothetical protein